MYHFRSFPRKHRQVISQPNVLQSVHLNELRYLQCQRQRHNNVQLDTLQVSNGISDSNFIPFYRQHTVVARVQPSRDMDSENMDGLQWSAENNEQKPEVPVVPLIVQKFY